MLIRALLTHLHHHRPFSHGTMLAWEKFAKVMHDVEDNFIKGLGSDYSEEEYMEAKQIAVPGENMELLVCPNSLSAFFFLTQSQRNSDFIFNNTSPCGRSGLC